MPQGASAFRCFHPLPDSSAESFMIGNMVGNVKQMNSRTIFRGDFAGPAAHLNTPRGIAPQAFQLKFTTSYMKRLLQLADNATLRSEVAQFPLALDAQDAVLAEHRAGVHLFLAEHVISSNLQIQS